MPDTSTPHIRVRRNTISPAPSRLAPPNPLLAQTTAATSRRAVSWPPACLDVVASTGHSRRRRATPKEELHVPHPSRHRCSSSPPDPAGRGMRARIGRRPRPVGRRYAYSLGRLSGVRRAPRLRLAPPRPTRRAESAFTAGRYPEATQLFTAYTATHPENPWGHYMLGMSAWKTGEPEKALRRSTRRFSSTQSPEEPVQLQPGIAGERPPEGSAGADREGAGTGADVERRAAAARPGRYELGDVDGAIEAYHRALSIDERDVWAMNNLGLIYIQQDRSSEALAAAGPGGRAQKQLAGVPEQSGHGAGAGRLPDGGRDRHTKPRSRWTAATRRHRWAWPGSPASRSRSRLRWIWRRSRPGSRRRSRAWRGAVVTDSSAVATDSRLCGPFDRRLGRGDGGSVGDSVLVSGRIVADSLEECESEEDQIGSVAERAGRRGPA